MIAKFLLYIDSVRRFNLKQLYYFIVNKFIKKYLFVLHKYKPKKYDDFGGLFENLHSVKINNGLNIFNVGITKKYNINNYYNQLELELLNNSLHNFSFENLNDFQIANNLQRFYLFDNVIKDNKLDSNKNLSLILKWIKNYPKQKNIAWNSFNCSMRLLNWIRILSNFSENQIDKENLNIIVNSINEQALFIKKNIEHHIPGNHIIMQYFSLWMVSIVFNKWENYDELLIFSEKMLKRELKKEFLPNGFHVEQSFHYHLQITLMGLYWLYLSKEFDRFISERIKNIIKRASEICFEFRLPDGSFPMLSDNCYNFFNEDIFSDFENFKFLFNKIFGSCLKTNDNSILELEQQYLLFKNRENYLLFDIGNIGLKCNPGHGHSDLGNFIFAFNGVPLFIDPGVRNYSNNKDDLSLKKANSHNTLSVDNDDHAKLWGYFRWAYLPSNLKSRVLNENGKVIFEFEYNAFKHLGGIQHKRILTFNGNELKIFDTATSKSKHVYKLTFILHPAIGIKKCEGKIILSNFSKEWIMQVEGDSNFETVIKDQLIYPNYSFPLKSKKLTFLFPENYLLNSKVVVKEFNKYD